MIPNIHQSINEIIDAANPEQKILWQQARLISGERTSVRQIYYSGALAGSEFLNYVANKLYIVNSLRISTIATLGAGYPLLTLFDQNNAAVFTYNNLAPVWNATSAAINYISQEMQLKNILFSRITLTNATYVIINGYKLE